MRIAYVFDPLLPRTDTDTEQALNTISAFSRRGARISLYLPRPTFGDAPSPDTLRDYYKVTGSFDVRALRSLFPLPKLLRPVEKLAHATRVFFESSVNDFDLVYTRHLPVVFSSLMLGRRVVYETYRPWSEQVPVLRPALRMAMTHERFLGAVLHSEYTRERFLKLGVDPERLLVAHNGYQPELFEPRLSSTDARRQLGLAEGPTVLYAGRVTMGKGLGIVLEMADRLPHVNFVLVGSEQNGAVEKAANTRANVEVRGWVSYDELAPFLYAADILLIPPSLIPLEKVGNTVLPMKLFLYLAAGRPVLAPRAPDTAELLVHDENAYLVTPDDLSAAVAATERLIGDQALAARLGSASRKLAAGLTWDSRADRVLGFVDARLSADRFARAQA